MSDDNISIGDSSLSFPCDDIFLAIADLFPDKGKKLSIHIKLASKT